MYNQSGDIIQIARELGNKIDVLPSATYTVEQSPKTGEFFLMKTNPFKQPSKVYGEMNKRNEKVINTFLSREGKNTGVLLSGTKGSGKTQLAKDVSTALLQRGIPTIIIQNCYTCGDFINFIKAIEDKALILFDEFEKVYSKRVEQESILTLLDGTGSYNKLYILTSNSTDVSEFLRNRPSRIYYHFDYKKLSKQVMFDLLNDKLVNKKFITQFDILWESTETVSFDMIQCLVEELNRYPNQTFTETFKELNVEVDSCYVDTFILSEFTINGKNVKFDKEYLNKLTTFTFVSNIDDLLVYFFVEEGTMIDELKAINSHEYTEYDEYDDEKQHVIEFEFRKNDTIVNSTGITINRVLNGINVHAKFVKTKTPDVVDLMFDGK